MPQSLKKLMGHIAFSLFILLYFLYKISQKARALIFSILIGTQEKISNI